MKKIVLLGFVLAALSFVVSCASTPAAKPQPEPAQPAPAPEQPAAVPAPDTERAQAKALQQKVDQYSLGTYDQADYQTATQALKAGEDAYGKDNATAKTSYLAAIDGYNAVLSKGGPLFLDDVQKKTDASKRAADDLKASVAVTDDYAKADAVYQRALQEKASGDIDAADKDFTDAQAQFDAVAKVAAQKKDTAEQALQSAQQQETASQQKATDADNQLKQEGFAPSGS